MNQTRATFCMPAEQLMRIAEADAVKSGAPEVAVEIVPIFANKLCAATGPTQAIMFLIGAVAANGEDTLYGAGSV